MSIDFMKRDAEYAKQLKLYRENQAKIKGVDVSEIEKMATPINATVKKKNKKKYVKKKNTKKKRSKKNKKPMDWLMQDEKRIHKIELKKYTAQQEAVIKNQKRAKTEAYDNYLLSEAWQNKRLIILERDNYKCVHCGAEEYLNVHHLTYKHFKKERNEELVTLCKTCHSTLHSIYKSLPLEKRKQLRRTYPLSLLK
jgi:5-methylcytosine-specific restriction endonuclease McrA